MKICEAEKVRRKSFNVGRNDEAQVAESKKQKES